MEATPEAKYTKFGEKIRHVIPGPMQCSMACGGRNCKWENPSRWNDEDQVIKGVFSSWVLDDVVAMSRPSTEVIQKYDLIKQFKQNKITSIINLQRPGEHASCGPPLNKESQFTYLPQVFMDNNIFFYNFGWKDYGVTSLETILDMVKVMAFALTEGKVAVHCHAGLGRTGVLIACYLVYAHRMDATSAINTVRKRRPNSIQTRGQIACIQEFAQFLKPLRIVFPQVVPHAERLTLAQFLHRQRHMLHGFESRELRYLPKIVSVVCQRLVEIATTSGDHDLYDRRTRSNTGPKPKSGKKNKKNTLQRSNTVETLKDTLPGAFVNEHLEDDTFLNPTDSQEMKALLSPRLRRKSESAVSKLIDLSHSRPESPVTADAMKQFNFNANNATNEPILVASVVVQQQVSATAPEQSGDTGEKIPGKPQVVLVKQGSRSGLLSMATNISQTQQDAGVNKNNNNQSMPSSISLSQDNEKFDAIDQKPKGINNSSIEKTFVTDKNIEITKPSLPSPTPSVHEPQISPRGRSSNKDTQNAGGDKPLLQNIRSSAGRSQRILPTGMPTHGRLGSGKGKKLSLFADDEKAEIQNEGDETTKSEDKDGKSDDEKAAEEDEQNLDIKNALNDTSEGLNNEMTIDLKTQLNSSPETQALDHDLEEIFETKSESDDLKEDSGATSFLSLSAASKVSWTEQLNNQSPVDSELQQQKGETVPDEGRHTPLMYRAEQNQEMLENTAADDSNSDKDSSDQDFFSNVDQLTELTSTDSKTTQKSARRPKSAGFLKRMSENNQQGSTDTRPHLRSLQLTQSLCDLRHHEEMSWDELAMLKSDFNGGMFSHLSPGSKSSSSDDIRTPTGSATKRRIKDPITVAMALAYKLTDNEWLWEKVYTRQVELNTREGAWSGVEQEVDAHLLSCLMWSWVEHLSEPALTSSDIDELLKESRPNHDKQTSSTECPDPTLFEKALSKLGKPISATLRCVLQCLLSLPPLSFELEASVVRRVMSAFTQFYIQSDDSDKYVDRNQKHEQLVSLIQNYLVKTRVRNSKKQSSDGGSSKENEPILDETRKDLRGSSTNPLSSDSGKDECEKGEGDSSSSTKLPELKPQIAVS